MNKILIVLSIFFILQFSSNGKVAIKQEKECTILKNKYYRIVIDQNCGARIKSLKYIPTGQELIGRWKKSKMLKEWGYEGGFWRDFAYGSWPGYYSYKPYKVKIIRNGDLIVAHFRHRIGVGRLKGVVIDKSLTINDSRKLKFKVSIINDTVKENSFNFKMHNELSFGKDRDSLYLVSTKYGVESLLLNCSRGKVFGNTFMHHKGDWQGIIDISGNNILLTRFGTGPKVVSTLLWLTSTCRSYEWIYDSFKIAPGAEKNLNFSLELMPLGENWDALAKQKLITVSKLAELRKRFGNIKKQNTCKTSAADNYLGFILAVKDKNERWYGDEIIKNSEVGTPLKLDVAQGEISGTTFAIKGLRDLNIDSISIQNELFKNPDWIDFRIVKVWWQGGNPKKQTLGPELLLHDDSIIETTKKGNVLKYKGDLPVDPPKLLSFKVHKDSFRQVWVSIKVPKKQKPGIYKTTIVAKSGNKQAVLPFEITVRPFSLASNRRATGMYVHQKPDSPAAALERKRTGYSPMSWTRNCKQSKRADYIPDNMFVEVLKTLREAGLRDNVYYAYNRHVFFVDMLKKVYGKEINNAQIVFIGMNHAVKMAKEFRKRNIKIDTYGYIADEPKTEKDFLNVAQRHSYLKRQGVKSAAALSSLESFKRSKNNVDLALSGVEGSVPYIKQIISYNKKNKRQTNGYFQSHTEDYLRNRVIYGLYLWRAGFDGIVAYCFMDIKAGKKPGPVAYDDTRSYDNGRRIGEHNLMMAYPTADGKLIPTLHLEGVRDGINDLRYIETLEQLIERNNKLQKKLKITKAAENFLQDFKASLPFSYSSIYNLYRGEEYQTFRNKFSKWIKALM